MVIRTLVLHDGQATFGVQMQDQAGAGPLPGRRSRAAEESSRDLTGLVLAGGQSQRMGQDKALLVVDGEPLVARIAHRLASCCRTVLIAAGDSRPFGIGWPEVRDTLPGAGPLAGLHAGLAATRTPLAAAVAVDMPLVSCAVIALLAELWDGEPAVVPVADGRLQPLHAVYAASAAPQLHALLRAGERSATAAVRALGARVVQPSEWLAADPAGRFAWNVNRPDDLALLAEGPVAWR